jgi:hypothetical protein
MKKSLMFALFVFFFAPIFANAQSAFDGVWKFDINKAQLPKKPDVYLLQDGTYHCNTCVPPIVVKADGQDQKVTGHPYFDTISVKVVDDHTVELTQKKDGKVNGTSKSTVSSDDNTLRFEFSDSSASNSDPVTGKGESARVAKGPAGSHAISGSWRTTKLAHLSDNALLVTFKLEGDSFSMSNPTGQSYTAKLDGTDAPFKGDPGTTSVSVKRLGKNSIEETDKRDGKVIAVSRITVGADGRSMNITFTDKLHGTTSEFPAVKQ